MKPTQLFRHVTVHNGKFTWQLTILGHPCRTSAHFDTPEEAAVSVDLVKFYLRTEFELALPYSLDGDVFSDLAYSRRNVILSDCLSVAKSMPEDVKEFINEHGPALLAHRAAAPPETIASKFRRSGMIEQPAVREWIEKLEAAEMDSAAFAEVDSNSFFLRLSVVEKSLTTILKSLGLALRMHNEVTNPRLVDRAHKLDVLNTYVAELLAYVVDITKEMKAEQASVESAVSALEANRPPLS